MYGQNPATAQKLRATLKLVLLVEANPNYARMLSDMLRMLGAEQIIHYRDHEEALDKAPGLLYTLIVCSHQAPECDALAFTKGLRRSNASCRKSPIITIAPEITMSLLNDIRDSGADEFMRKPFTWGDLQKRVEHVALKARPWIEAVGYVGPDRRRFNSGDYNGPRKRAADNKDQKTAQIEQAVRILKAAFEQYNSDPLQARRAMYAQLEVLVPACKTIASQSFHNDVRTILTQLREEWPDLKQIRPAVLSLAAFMKIEDRHPSNAA
ncbi:MAG: response regulator [Asticcacaulis sp.]|uniref:response regulator n=1 Tax=Asticcacaulis sp. TaxID=1872648 RepID=UPI0025BBDAD4|nr:response regulator [Asticcacaulis sp.]MCA1934596.1 response regulator [Asticcacaulis sp.]